MKKYVGSRREGITAVVVVDNETGRGRLLDPGSRHVNHSPTGFEWGYTGSGPAQLAFAILLDYFNAPGQAMLLYQDFKHHVIATLNADEWTLTADEIEQHLARIRVLRSRSRSEETNWQSST